MRRRPRWPSRAWIGQGLGLHVVETERSLAKIHLRVGFEVDTYSE
jgi:hypothetical protein